PLVLVAGGLLLLLPELLRALLLILGERGRRPLGLLPLLTRERRRIELELGLGRHGKGRGDRLGGGLLRRRKGRRGRWINGHGNGHGHRRRRCGGGIERGRGEARGPLFGKRRAHSAG